MIMVKWLQAPYINICLNNLSKQQTNTVVTTDQNSLNIKFSQKPLQKKGIWIACKLSYSSNYVVKLLLANKTTFRAIE